MCVYMYINVCVYVRMNGWMYVCDIFRDFLATKKYIFFIFLLYIFKAFLIFIFSISLNITIQNELEDNIIVFY